MTRVRNRATTMRTGSSFQKDLPPFFGWGFLAGVADLASASFIPAPPASPAAGPSDGPADDCPPGASPCLPWIRVAGGSPGAFPSSVIGPSLVPSAGHGRGIRAHSE